MPQCKQHVLPPKSTRRCAIQRGNIDCNSRAAPPSRRRCDSLSPLSPYRSNSVASWAAGLRSSARWLAVICCARPRRWAASSSCPRPRSPSSDLAAANGMVPTSDVGWWAARKVWGSSALFPSSAFSQASQASARKKQRRRLQLAKSRALFEYTWRFRNESDARAVPPAPSVAASGPSLLSSDGGSLRATWSQRHNGNRAIRAPQAVPFGTHAVQGVLRRFTGPYGASGRVGPALRLQNVRGGRRGRKCHKFRIPTRIGVICS